MKRTEYCVKGVVCQAAELEAIRYATEWSTSSLDIQPYL